MCQRDYRPLISWGVLFFALPLISCEDPLRHVPVTASPPAWSLDLREFGYGDGINVANRFAALRQITFVDAETIAVSFVSSSSEEGPLMRRGHVALVDAETGKLRRSIQWDCDGHCNPYVFSTSAGHLLVSDYGTLDLYSASLEHLRRIQFPAGTRVVHISPDGSTVAREEGKPGEPLAVFMDSETFEETGPRFASNVRAISNRKLAREAWPAGSRYPAVYVQAPDAPEFEFHPKCRSALPHFISEDKLVVANCSELSVITDQGQIIFADRFPRAEVSIAASARNGNRFAVSVTAHRGWDPPVLHDELVVVYEVSARKRILAIRIRPLPYIQTRAALSSDGSMLATDAGGELRLYRLP
jgi:hypothetical protein